MKKVKTVDNWFGERDVLLHGDDRRDPLPSVGEVVLLTGGRKVKIESLGCIQSKTDAYRGASVWYVPAEVSFFA